MDESRRRAYLRAMGIDLWVPRQAAEIGSAGSAAVSAAPPAPPEPPRIRVELSEPKPEPALEQGPPWESDWEPVLEPEWEPVPADEVRPPAPPSAPATRPASPTAGPDSLDATAVPPALPSDPALMDWATLAAVVAGCRACPLCETRTRTVFGVGDRQARLLVIGEAPGADEDREGEPFVGRAGQLLNRMLAAIGLTRDQVYIANILKCRPPGNRDPRPDEVRHCQGYLTRQVDLIRPRAILAVGRISAQTLLATETSLGRLRGRWFDFGPDAIPLRVTYHPAYLLRSPENKGKAWEDLSEVARRLGSEGIPSLTESH